MLKKLFVPLLFLFAVQLQAQTWADDVACIVYTHCANCHSPGNIGPFPLMNYAEAFDARFSIQNAVTEREMPPWKAEVGYGDHIGKRTLTDEEVALIDAWVNNGAPEGMAGNAPPPPVFNSPEEIQNPDLTVKIPAYHIPDNLPNDLYRVFAIPATLPDDRFITGIEVVPGNRAVVHHVLVYQDSTGQALSQDAADPEPGYTAFGGIGVFGAELIGAWVPGSGAEHYPPNMGVHLPQNTAIVLQIHYPVDAAGQWDSTHVNFTLSDGSLRQVSIAPVLNHGLSMVNGPLSIPPNQVKTFEETYTVPIQATVLAIAPHAHLICTSMKAFGVTLQGDTIPLVDIPEWDFHWQGAYKFQQPIKLNPLTKLYGFATYDNTSGNPDNPNSPPQTVSVGEATTDEMMLFYFTYTAYQSGDENMVIDTTSHKPHYLDCETHTVISGTDEQPHLEGFTLYPNPAAGFITIEKRTEAAARLRLLDFSGHLVLEEKLSGSSEQISLLGLPEGIYAASLFLENGQLVGTQRVVVLR